MAQEQTHRTSINEEKVDINNSENNNNKLTIVKEEDSSENSKQLVEPLIE